MHVLLLIFISLSLNNFNSFPHKEGVSISKNSLDTEKHMLIEIGFMFLAPEKLFEEWDS